MGAVNLDDDRATDAERGRSVVAEHTHENGRVACAEDGYRTQRSLDPDEARAGLGGVVDRHSEVAALRGYGTVEAQLGRGPCDFRQEAFAPQTRFQVGDA